MKNFKFRAWDKELKIMCDVLKIDFKNKTLFYHHWAHGVSTEVDLNEVEIMQSTGLKDISGTEIYEGDIVEFKYPYDKRIKTKGVIVRNDNKACFGISMKETTEQYELYRITAENYLTVIGDVYQNPELLEDE